MRRNIELKARVDDLPAARLTAQRVATQHLGSEHQIDTYFDCRHGRLKLRQIDAAATLIWYARPDHDGPRGSDYLLVPVADAGGLKQALTAACGLKVVVEKRREILLHHNVRIHLDEVAGLGQFLEFEAVLGTDLDDAAGVAQLERLSAEFNVRAEQVVPESYSDLLVEGR